MYNCFKTHSNYQDAIDLESELKGITRINSKHPIHSYQGKRTKATTCSEKNESELLKSKTPEYRRLFKKSLLD